MLERAVKKYVPSQAVAKLSDVDYQTLMDLIAIGHCPFGFDGWENSGAK
ncbi:hypothetical protein LJC56_09585 [Christensenellaceae bacterium OttesenSCG-928-K19]|nr:hypothetical protein [Christensenellaceae bacterium OttesenSCG-928-K19]